ncbi:MAG: FAD-binding protein [Propionibacterium sp.]
MATTMRLAQQISTPETSWTHHTGVVIVGAGAAGLGVAIHLLRAHVPAVLISRRTLASSATVWSLASGSQWREPPTTDALVEQGEGLADADAASAFVTAAPRVLKRLGEFATAFDTRPADPRQPSGAQVQRTLAAAVHTAANSPSSSLRIDTDRRAIDVLTDDGGHVAGLRVVGRDGIVGDYLAPVVVLANGGSGQLWDATTAPRDATGDGLAMALRAGAALRDLEFVNFTATALAASARIRLPGEPLVELGSALLRAGARIVDKSSQPVLPDLGPLESVPEATLAMAVADALAARADGAIFLDARSLGEQTWGLAPYLATARACRENGADPARVPLPIRPAVQSMVGGIATDGRGATNVPGLFAAGEVACTGALGAAGPANASIVQALVTGDAVGAALGSSALPQPGEPAQREAEGCLPASTLPGIRTAADSALWLSREHEQLRSASDFLSRLPGDDEFSELNLTATNLRAVGAAVTAAATARPETRGWHRRADHPEASPKWLRTISVALDENANLRVTSAPVVQK